MCTADGAHLADEDAPSYSAGPSPAAPTSGPGATIVAAVAAVVVAAALVVGWVVLATRDSGPSQAGGSGSVADAVFPSDLAVPALSSVRAPSSADATGGISVSDAGVGVAGEGDVVVEVYFDFMCPYCGLFDQTNAADLDALVAEGGVTVVYHPVSILDRASQGTAYSTRAVNAVAVVADRDPQHVPAFVTALFADGTQPQEGTGGLTDDQIAQVAQSVGVSRTVTDRLTATTQFQGTRLRTFVPWTVAATGLLPADAQGRRSTPTVLVDGQPLESDWTQTGTLRAAVEAAKG